MKIKTFLESICMLLSLVLLCALVVVAFAEPDYNFEEITYEIKTGDRLWDIADEYCPQSMNKWDYIYLIMERNKLDNSVIYPGECLVIYQSQN